MPLLNITAKFECDKCGEKFTAKVPNDADTANCPTVFELICENMDMAQKEGSHQYQEAFYHDGEFFGPCCAEKKINEVLIEEIKAGRYTKQQVIDMEPDFVKYLPKMEVA